MALNKMFVVVQNAFFDVQFYLVVQNLGQLLRQSRLVKLHQPHINFFQFCPDYSGGLSSVDEDIVD